MTKLEKYLHYYGILFSIFILFYALFFIPKPQKFWLLFSSLPLIIYFCLKRNKAIVDQNGSQGFWTSLTLAVLFIQITAGCLGFFFYLKEIRKSSQEKVKACQEIAESKEPLSDQGNKKILEDLAAIKGDLNKVKAEQQELNFVLSSSTSAEENMDVLSSLDILTSQLSQDILKNSSSSGAKTSGWLTVSSKTRTAPIYKDKSFSSRIVGYSENGEILPFAKKENNWYLVKLNNQTEGWINASSIKEINHKLP